MNRRLGKEFFTQETLVIAQDFLGKYLVRKIGKRCLTGKVVETEAYIGPKDRASHAYGGKVTRRNRAEYLRGGHVYIYLVYGMYWQLNISTARAGEPECVLIRALEVESMDRSIANGQGKLCNLLKLDQSFYAEDVTRSKRFWVEDRGERFEKSQIYKVPRVGIDYAGWYWTKKRWRFYIAGNPCVSRS